jgi:hypothetical protein
MTPKAGPNAIVPPYFDMFTDPPLKACCRLNEHIQFRRAWSKKSKIFIMFSGLRQMTVM